MEAAVTPNERCSITPPLRVSRLTRHTLPLASPDLLSQTPYHAMRYSQRIAHRRSCYGRSSEECVKDWRVDWLTPYLRRDCGEGSNLLHETSCQVVEQEDIGVKFSG